MTASTAAPGAPAALNTPSALNAPIARAFAPGLFIRGFTPPLPLSAYKLVAFDMDSTLINIECVDEIAAVAGRNLVHALDVDQRRIHVEGHQLVGRQGQRRRDRKSVV